MTSTATYITYEDTVPYKLYMDCLRTKHKIEENDGRPLMERGTVHLSKSNENNVTDEQTLQDILGLVAAHSSARSSAGETLQGYLTSLASRSLLGRYGTLDGVVKAPAAELALVPGVGPAGAALLAAVHALMLKSLRSRITGRSVLTCWDDLLNYLKATLGGERVESFRILFLDSGFGLITDEEIARGTIDHVSCYPREVARRCLELDAGSIIVVHNHPNGSPAPSAEDLQMTAELSKALALFGMTIVDHVIVGGSGLLSFRMENLLMEPGRTCSAPENFVQASVSRRGRESEASQD